MNDDYQHAVYWKGQYDRSRRALRLGIAAVVLCVLGLVFMALRHAVAMNRCYIPGETIQLETDHRPAIMTTSLVHYTNRRVWKV